MLLAEDDGFSLDSNALAGGAHDLVNRVRSEILHVGYSAGFSRELCVAVTENPSHQWFEADRGLAATPIALRHFPAGHRPQDCLAGADRPARCLGLWPRSPRESRSWAPCALVAHKTPRRQGLAGSAPPPGVDPSRALCRARNFRASRDGAGAVPIRGTSRVTPPDGICEMDSEYIAAPLNIYLRKKQLFDALESLQLVKPFDHR